MSVSGSSTRRPVRDAPTAEAAQVRRPSMLRNGPFVFYMIAEVTSGAGKLAQITAMAWMVVSSGPGNGLLLSCIVGAALVPSLLLSMWGGRLVDGGNPGRLLVITSGVEGASAAVFAVIFLTTDASLWCLVVLALAIGVIGVVDTPARQRFIARTVGDADLQRALGVFQAGFGVARIGGPLLAGLALAVVAPGWVLLANAVTFVLPMVAVTMIRKRSAAAPQPARPKPGPGAVRIAWRHPVMRSCLFTTFAAGTFGMQYSVTNPMIVRSVHLGSAGLGRLDAALAAGAIVGSLLAARLPYRGPVYGLFATSAMGMFMVLIGVAGREVLLLPLCALLGMTVVVTSTTVGATVQRVTPEDYRGRMVALNWLAFTAAFPLGSVLVGLINDVFGIAAATATTGLACTAIALGATLYWLARRNSPSAVWSE